ncbi:MAG: FaeA/PapI family transcriptional regulator [Minisyncoccia bacterium]
MTNSPISRLQPSIEKRRAKKRERLEKIMQFATSHYSITNNDVQILLGVSDATATRYLEELTKAGRLQRSGNRAAAVYRPQV